MSKTLFLLFSFLFLSCTIFGHSIDNKVQATNSVLSDTVAAEMDLEYDESNVFSPGLFFFAMVGLVIILVYVGAGIILTILGLLIIFGLVSFGILSTSIIIGLYKKSFAKGFKTFIVLASTTCGLVFCSIGFWILNKIVHWWTTQTAIITGATYGVLAGFTFGLLAYYILQKLTTYFTKKLS